MIQLGGILLKLRLALQHNVVLVHLRVHRVDLPLAEGVIQSVIDCRRRDAESRGGRPVNREGYSEPSGLLISRDTFQFWQPPQLADEAVGPGS